MSYHPLQILHVNYNKTDNFPELVRQTVKVCHMSRGEAALFMFYAGCSSGFTPSLKLIAEKCGVQKNYVSTIRGMLINKGILSVVGSQLLMHWDRIKIMSSLDPKMTSKTGWVKPIPPVGLTRLGKFMERWPTALELYTLPLDELIERLGRMPQWVYTAWRAQVNRDLANGLNNVNQIIG